MSVLLLATSWPDLSMIWLLGIQERNHLPESDVVLRCGNFIAIVVGMVAAESLPTGLEADSVDASRLEGKAFAFADCRREGRRGSFRCDARFSGSDSAASRKSASVAPAAGEASSMSCCEHEAPLRSGEREWQLGRGGGGGALAGV